LVGVHAASASPGDPSDVTAGACPQGKISRNVYRVPYATGMIGDQGGNDFVAHCGAFDTRARTRVCTNTLSACTSNSQCSPGGTCEFVLVAPANGIVCSVIEHFDDCGCSGSYGPFGNAVVILHANGEMSAFLHLKQWSPSIFDVQPGMQVSAGTPIGVEGDVGRTCNGDNSLTTCVTDGRPRIGTCLETLPSDATNCYRHIHWGITRYNSFGNFESVQPFTCGISGNVYEPNTSFTAGSCASVACGADLTLPNQVFSGYGTFQVFQGRGQYTANSITVQNQASVAMHACDKVTLRPGFHADAGAYFRAEIGLPNRTAPSAWPAPASCPCGDTGWRMCVQRSDPTEADNVEHLCNPPGPFTDGCHGCGFTGATRCCPCVTNGTCEDDGTCP
jgi:hypothetical protein